MIKSETFIDMLAKSMSEDAVVTQGGMFLRPVEPIILEDGQEAKRTLVIAVAMDDLVNAPMEALAGRESDEFWTGTMIFIPQKKWKGSPKIANDANGIVRCMKPDEFDKQIFPIK